MAGSRIYPRALSALFLVLALLVSAACGAGSKTAKPAFAAVPVTSTVAARSPTPALTPAVNARPSTTAAAGATQSAADLEDRQPLVAGPPIHVDALALGGSTAVRTYPSMKEGRTARLLIDRQPVVILREVRGERWVVGEQTWSMATQDWSNLWYQVDGGYVYAGFVFIPRPGDLDALADRSGSHWVEVDLNAQTATAMVGDKAARVAGATTGKPGYETPGGEHSVQYRKINETMTSSQAAIQDPAEQYDVKNVLYTQYFDGDGDALHLNYWQPEGVFGHQRTSHGCVGLALHDAQFFWLFATNGSRVSIHPVAEPPATPASAAIGTGSPAPAATGTPGAAATGTPGSGPNQRFTRDSPIATPAITPPPPPTFTPRPLVR